LRSTEKTREIFPRDLDKLNRRIEAEGFYLQWNLGHSSAEKSSFETRKIRQVTGNFEPAPVPA
jgi:uncharacterized protein YcgL (UPF0745 family)